MDESQMPTRSELLAEVERLQAEVDRLHRLLNFDSRPDDGHRRAWAPILFGGSEPVAGVSQASTLEEKVGLLRSLFGGRSDVFAQRLENPRTGKSGWSPAVRGGWSKKRPKPTDYEFHDYVDEHVPVLARMHAKRLPAYKTLGFDHPIRISPPQRADDAF